MTLPVTFTGTSGDALSTYDSEWERRSGDTGVWVISNANRARRGTASQSIQYTYAGFTPASADYDVSADYVIMNTSTVERVGVIGRASVNDRTFYVARLTVGSTTATWTLMKFVAGTSTILDTNTRTIATNDVIRGTLSMQGDLIRILDNDVEVCSANDSAITQVGRIGVYATSDSSTPGNSAGCHLDNIDVEEAAPAERVLDSSITLDGIGLSSSILTTEGLTVDASITLGGVTLSCDIETEPLGPETLVDTDFAGCNVDVPSIVITNPHSTTPTVRFSVRTPDDAEWQQYVAKLTGVADKTVTVEVSVTGKEVDPDTYLGTYQGPWWSPTITADSWTLIGSHSIVSGYKTYSFSPGSNDEVFIASVPPATQDSVLAWIQSLETSHSTLVHDDLPSRVAYNDGAYVCDRSGIGEDENGREISNLPLYGFRLANDALGVFPKRKVVVFSGVHCGEWNGFHMLKGFADEYLTGTYATELQTNFDVYVYPLHSVLGNYLGFRRAEPLPNATHFDANREWTDGDTTVPTVVKWQAILDADHGVAHDNVVFFLDFHDGKKTSAQAYYYYQPGWSDQAAYQALISAENASITASESTADGTTCDYWESKGVTFAINPEVADEKSTITELEAFGAAYARSIKTADDANLIGEPSEAASVDFTATLAGISLTSAITSVDQLDSAIQLGSLILSSAIETTDQLDVNITLGGISLVAVANAIDELNSDIQFDSIIISSTLSSENTVTLDGSILLEPISLDSSITADNTASVNSAIVLGDVSLSSSIVSTVESDFNLQLTGLSLSSTLSSEVVLNANINLGSISLTSVISNVAPRDVDASIMFGNITLLTTITITQVPRLTTKRTLKVNRPQRVITR